MLINFTAMTGRFSRLLRLPIRAVPPGTTMRVLQGPLRGAKWIHGASSAGCWLGTFEVEVQRVLAKLIHRGDVVYDLGANVGFFTLLASRLAGPEGCVYAFEPMPENLTMLRRHLAMNRVHNVEVIEAAVYERDGELAFGGAQSIARVSDTGRVRVRGVALDGLWRAARIAPPNVIKMDIEGAELPALRGMRGLLESARPHLVIEFHGAVRDGEDLDAHSRDLLVGLGYQLTRLSGGECVARPT